MGRHPQAPCLSELSGPGEHLSRAGQGKARDHRHTQPTSIAPVPAVRQRLQRRKRPVRREQEGLWAVGVHQDGPRQRPQPASVQGRQQDLRRLGMDRAVHHRQGGSRRGESGAEALRDGAGMVPVGEALFLGEGALGEPLQQRPGGRPHDPGLGIVQVAVHEPGRQDAGPQVPIGRARSPVGDGNDPPVFDDHPGIIEPGDRVGTGWRQHPRA